MKPLVMRNTQSPGDIIVLSAAIRDLHLHYPGKFETSISVSKGAEDAYEHNPNIAVRHGNTSRKDWFAAHYPLIHKSNQQRKHFVWGFIEDMNKRLKLQIKLSAFRPDLYMSAEEIAEPLIEPPYWLFLSGGKTDFQAKIWDQVYWQQVIDGTRDQVRWVQCGGGSKNHIRHIPKHGIYANMIAKTGLRKFMRLIYHADGVVCVVTAAMHIAAAFNKPCIVIAGGREPWWWEAYNEENRLVNMCVGTPNWKPPPDDDFVPHTYLHTIGDLDCCKKGGCWKGKVRPKDARGQLPKGSTCKRPVFQNGELIPECKAMIKPEMVIEAISDYYRNGLVRDRKLVMPLEDMSAVFCIFDDGAPEAWIKRTCNLMPETPLVIRGISRREALTEAISEGKDWIFWFEHGSVPAAHWKFGLRRQMGTPAVYGRIHRTQQGELYPYPGFFAVHRSLLDANAETYAGLFAGIPQDKLRSESNVKIPMMVKEVA